MGIITIQMILLQHLDFIHGLLMGVTDLVGNLTIFTIKRRTSFLSMAMLKPKQDPFVPEIQDIGIRICSRLIWWRLKDFLDKVEMIIRFNVDLSVKKCLAVSVKKLKEEVFTAF